MCGPLNLPVQLLLAGHLSPWVKQLSCGTNRSCQLRIYCVAIPLLSRMSYGMILNRLALKLNAWFGVQEFGIEMRRA